MIGYEDMLWRDAPNYFGGCFAFEWDASRRTMTPYRMHFAGDYSSNDLAYDCDVALYPTDEAHDPFTPVVPLEVTGEELWTDARFITHRFEVEYVPISPTLVVRVSIEPHASRMTKGMSSEFVHYLPILGTDPSRFVMNTTRPSSSQLVQGIAKVLEIGTPPVMMRRMPRDQAHARARMAVLNMMQSRVTQSVCVPDFKWAIIKHRTHRRWAYVLRSGRHVGYLRINTNNEDLTFFGIRSTVEDRPARSIINAGLRDDAQRLLCDRVEWVMSGVCPINQSRYNLQGE